MSEKVFQQGYAEILRLRKKGARKINLRDFRKRWIKCRIETNFMPSEPQFKISSFS